MDASEDRRRRRLVQRWRASGSSAKEFAAAHGLKASQLYEWARGTKDRSAKKASSIAFTEVRAREQRESATGSAIEIELRGHLIRVRVGADLQMLEAVLAMVSRC